MNDLALDSVRVKNASDSEAARHYAMVNAVPPTMTAVLSEAWKGANVVSAHQCSAWL